jgi:hypothetical protein
MSIAYFYLLQWLNVDVDAVLVILAPCSSRLFFRHFGRHYWLHLEGRSAGMCKVPRPRVCSTRELSHFNNLRTWRWRQEFSENLASYPTFTWHWNLKSDSSSCMLIPITAAIHSDLAIQMLTDTSFRNAFKHLTSSSWRRRNYVTSQAVGKVN